MKAVVSNPPGKRSSTPPLPAPRRFKIFRKFAKGLLPVAGMMIIAIIVFMTVVEPRRTLVDVQMANRELNKVRVARFQQRLTWERRLNLNEQKAANDKRAYIDKLMIDDRPLGTLAFAGGVLRQMTREILVGEEARRRGLAVSDDEVQLYIEQTYGLLPSDAPAKEVSVQSVPAKQNLSEPSAVFSPALPTQTREQREETARAKFKSAGLPPEYREVVRAELIEKKVRAAFAAEIPTQEDRVRLRLIRFETPESASEAVRLLDQSRTFDVLYIQVQDGKIGNAAGTTVEWTSRRELQRDFNAGFAQTIFEIKVGDALKAPLAAANGWYLGAVDGHELRTLSEEWRKQRGIDAYQSWIEQQQPRVTEYALWMSRVPPLEGVRLVTEPIPMAGMLPTPQAGAPANKSGLPTGLGKGVSGLGRDGHDKHSSSPRHNAHEIPGAPSHNRSELLPGSQPPVQPFAVPRQQQGGILPGAAPKAQTPGTGL